MTGARAPLLVVGVGNPSRGDDALGPTFLARIEAACAGPIARGEVELLTDFQLQIEHALDLEGRARVVFVDASVAAPAPFSFARVEARASRSAASHALSPSEVLAVMGQIGGRPPEAFVLAIRGERFELGEEIGGEARRNLDAAVAFFLREVAAGEEPRRGVQGNVPDDARGDAQGDVRGSGAGAPT